MEKVVQLAFYHGPGDIITHTIRWVSQGNISHVEMVFSDGKWAGCSGREPSGVRWRLPPDSLDFWVFTPLRMSLTQEHLMKEFVTMHIGAAFDWTGVISFLLPFVSETTDRYYCTNFVVSALHHAGLYLHIPEHISPMALYNSLCGDGLGS